MKIFSENEIDNLAELILTDGVISVPTDTVYGLCTKINSNIAYDKLVNFKHRPVNKLFPIMCANELQIKSIAIVDKKIEKIIKKFMPGPITLILRKRDNIVINGIDNTVAVRIATSKVLEELINRTGPLFMTSANISGNKECQTIEEIINTFPSLDGILEGKPLFNKASTIIDCTSNELKIIRSGPVTLEQILKEIEG